MLIRPNRFLPAKGAPRMGAKQRALAQWRGVNVKETDIARLATSKSANRVVTRVLSELRIEQRLAESEILKVWENQIDPNITAHAKPVGLRKGTLFVNVDSSVWLNEIVRYRRREILERLRNSFGPELVLKISFRIG